jgi:hypothetical protein
MNRFTSVLLTVFTLVAAVCAPAQVINRRVRAVDYGQWRAVQQNTIASGSQTIQVSPCYFTPAGGSGPTFSPFNLYTRLTINGANSETVTPTAVGTPTADASKRGGCYVSVTATFSSAHSAGVDVTSGDGGIVEASYAVKNGGIVQLDGAFGSDTSISAIPLSPYAPILEDMTSPVTKWWTVQPSTLTPLATPATRSASAGATQVISGTATGTWTAAATYVCVTYVDRLGGESPCSATYNFTATVNVALNFASPAASTGAVGWRAYAGAAYNTAYQLPISTTTCTLSSQTPYPTCAIGSAGVFPDPITTTALRPGYTVNIYAPNTLSHTTFAYQAGPALLSSCGMLQTDFGPFAATVGGTTGQVQVIGTVPLTSGCLNSIHKTLRVTGKVTATNGTSETPAIKVMVGPTYTTGTPVAICTMSNTSALSAAVYSYAFSCTMTTNATGASGTIMPDGWAAFQLGAGTTTATYGVDTGTAAITTKLDTVNSIFVVYIGTSGTSTAVQLLDLHLEEL